MSLQKLSLVLVGVFALLCSTTAQINCNQAGEGLPHAMVELATGKYYIDKDYAGWEDIRQFCINFGLELFTVNSRLELETVWNATNYDGDYWTSGSFDEVAGVYKWSTGVEVPADLFLPGEPDHLNGQDKIALYGTGLKDDYYDSWNCIICELPEKCQKPEA